jgi:hypothetical protein
MVAKALVTVYGTANLRQRPYVNLIKIYSVQSLRVLLFMYKYGINNLGLFV